MLQKLENICRPLIPIPKFNKRRAFNKAVGPGKFVKNDKHRALNKRRA